MKLHSISKITAFVAAVLTLSACSDELMVQGGVPGNGDSFWSQYDFVISDDAETRVSYTDTKHSEFEEGDEVGVYVVDKDGNLENSQPTNVRYTVRSVTNINDGVQRQVLQPANPEVAVKKDPGYRYVLYYPYDSNMTLDRLKNYTHTVESNQNSHDAFEKSDLLWCYFTPPSSEDEAYVVEFDHAMAQIIVEVGEDATNVELLNMPLTAYGINLVQPLGDNFGYSAGVPPYPATEENTPITAYYFGYADSGNKIFRAVVPAHTFDEKGVGIPAVRITSGGGAKSYKISPREGGFTFRPGFIYTLTLNKGTGTTDIEITEDDSWVLDVYDPETNERVGLLCREYLLYEPDGAEYKHTGEEFTLNGETKKYVNSQAWVFYNLRADGTPELSQGTVLRFTYDVQVNFQNRPSAFGVSQAHYPFPHKMVNRMGLFLPRHGYYWTTQDHKQYLKDGLYGTELEVDDPDNPEMNEQNYHMHGGIVTWGYDKAGSHSYIADFTLPKEYQYESSQTLDVNGATVTVGDGTGYITNDQAQHFGHIAISKDGKVGVSYQPISSNNKFTDIGGCKVGVLQPHYLIDRRVGTDGDVEENAYPLVKIGHNQFWMSKSLRTNKFTDGTPITCYNLRGTEDNPKPAGVSFSSSDIIGAGYIYPYSQTITHNGSPYDPYNDRAERHPNASTMYPDMDFTVAPLYNKAAVEDDRFVPQSLDSRLYYQMPTADQVNDMRGYFRNSFVGKMFSDKNMMKTKLDFNNEHDFAWAYVDPYEGYSKDYYSALYGLICDDRANHYCANVSGFNLKARGCYMPLIGMEELNVDAVLILKAKNENQLGVDYLRFNYYQAFESDNFEAVYHPDEFGGDGQESYRNQLFAQVRLVMKLRNQLDNGGTAQSSLTRSAASVQRSCGEARSVRVELVP